MRARLYVVFLGKGMPLTTKHALIRTHTATLSVTEVTVWATNNRRPFSHFDFDPVDL